MKRRDFLRRGLQFLPAAALLSSAAACKKNTPAPAKREIPVPRKNVAAKPVKSAKPAARAKAAKVPFEWKGAPPPAGTAVVDPANSTAKALGYNPYATKVDAKKYAKYKKGQNCGNCKFFKSLNKDWGKCQLLPLGAVTNPGWCNAYVKKG